MKKIYRQTSLMIEDLYRPAKSNDWVKLPQFVWDAVFASYHFFIYSIYFSPDKVFPNKE